MGCSLPFIPATQSLENKTIDARFQIRGPLKSKSKVVVVAIDDKTNEAWEAIPKAFWAGNLAKISAEARRQGAIRVGVDIVVSVDPDQFLLERGIDETPNMDLYGEVVDSNGSVFLGTREGDDLAPPLDLLGPSSLLSPNVNQLDRSIIRHLPRWDTSFDPPIMSIANGLAGKDQNKRELIQINFSGSKPVIVSAQDLIDGNVHRGIFENAIVLIGETYKASQDRYDTPFSEDESGVLIHAEAIETILNNRELHGLPLIVTAVICGMLGLISGFIAHRFSIGKFVSFACVISIVWCIVAHFAFVGSNFVLPVVGPVMTFALLAPLCVFPMKAIEEKHERLWARSQWGQMVSDEFVAVLEANRSAGLGSMEAITSALFFLDVAGFSEKSNRMTSQQVVEGLNWLFDPIISQIGAHGGTVLNFIGDGVVAMFHKSDENGTFQQRAVLASIAILAATDQLKKEGEEIWDVRIGMAVGEVSLALVGSKERKQMTVYGAAVNMAARLEQAGKTLGTRLAVSVDFKDHLGEYSNRFVKSRIQPKGWDEEVEVLSLQE